MPRTICESSGLYGLLRPLDLIQPYRLEMKTKMANPRGKDLYTFWDLLTKELNKELGRTSHEVVLIWLLTSRIVGSKSVQHPHHFARF